MGANHARVLNDLKGADLVGVSDRNEDTAKEIAATNGVQLFSVVEELVEVIDAATIAVPSSLHADVACPILERGVHCLIEKPLATSALDAARLIDAARKGGSQLLVGHIERFNPAVSQLLEILDSEEDVLAVSARRMSAVSSRVLDVDVVSDLMVHDLDIVLQLLGDVAEVSARGVIRTDSPGEDYVSALLTSTSGAMATVTASRVTQNQIRELDVTTGSRFLTVDYADQSLNIFRQGRIGQLGQGPSQDSRYVLDIGTERVFVRRVEPLAVELRHFLDVARGAAQPVISGEQALRVLEVVWEIQHQVSEGVGHVR